MTQSCSSPPTEVEINDKSFFFLKKKGRRCRRKETGKTSAILMYPLFKVQLRSFPHCHILLNLQQFKRDEAGSNVGMMKMLVEDKWKKTKSRKCVTWSSDTFLLISSELRWRLCKTKKFSSLRKNQLGAKHLNVVVYFFWFLEKQKTINRSNESEGLFVSLTQFTHSSISFHLIFHFVLLRIVDFLANSHRTDRNDKISLHAHSNRQLTALINPLIIFKLKVSASCVHLEKHTELRLFLLVDFLLRRSTVGTIQNPFSRVRQELVILQGNELWIVY